MERRPTSDVGGIGTAGAVLGNDLITEVLAGRRLIDPSQLPPSAPDPVLACRRPPSHGA